jgi:hypothetical protein
VNKGQGKVVPMISNCVIMTYRLEVEVMLNIFLKLALREVDFIEKTTKLLFIPRTRQSIVQIHENLALRIRNISG